CRCGDPHGKGVTGVAFRSGLPIQKIPLFDPATPIAPQTRGKAGAAPRARASAATRRIKLSTN
ncbi:MAG TPA: hypothetical protein VN034_14295, partial [Sphingopyxis sp.]|nr:hypothetical protein [Sphingopyxis sp.]